MSSPGGRLKIVVLGATGSIGTQTLAVIDRFPDRFEVFGLVGGSRPVERRARFVVAAGQPDARERILELVTHPGCDLVVTAIPGAAALAPTLAALAAGKIVALASKEVLVMAGHLVMAAAQRRLRPIDSEHSAIWQCLWGEHVDSVARLVLTASGGPFRTLPTAELASVTVEQALNHPRWSMGPKVSIDSATLMNKGLELIEAHHLFGIDLKRIEVVVHPQSVVHSMVEFVDGSTKAQLGRPDMRLPIAIALAYPDRLPGVAPPLEPSQIGGLEFEALDTERFPAPALARSAAAAGAPFPAVLNAVNEEAVAAFLRSEIPFTGIVSAVESALGRYTGGGTTLDDVMAADAWGRDYFRSMLGKVSR